MNDLSPAQGHAQSATPGAIYCCTEVRPQFRIVHGMMKDAPKKFEMVKMASVKGNKIAVFGSTHFIYNL